MVVLVVFCSLLPGNYDWLCLLLLLLLILWLFCARHHLIQIFTTRSFSRSFACFGRALIMRKLFLETKTTEKERKRLPVKVIVPDWRRRRWLLCRCRRPLLSFSAVSRSDCVHTWLAASLHWTAAAAALSHDIALHCITAFSAFFSASSLVFEEGKAIEKRQESSAV